MTSLPIPELGNQVFIITDNNATFLDWLRTAIALVPLAHAKYYTLHHCCPAIYWEHGGGSDHDEAQLAWDAEENMRTRTERYFDRVSALLQEYGVPANHIRTQLSVEEDRPINAVMAELEHGRYSSVIVSSFHHEVVKRLRGGGLVDLFRPRPKVEVWALDEESLKLYMPHPVS
jgi:hypothetical protein